MQWTPPPSRACGYLRTARSQVQAISYQLLSEGRKLANDLGVELCGVVMGSEVNEDYLKALGGYGADRVYYIDSPC